MLTFMCVDIKLHMTFQSLCALHSIVSAKNYDAYYKESCACYVNKIKAP